MDGDAPFLRWLVVAFSAVILCFVGSTAYSELQAQEIGELSESLTSNAMPSIEHLASARAELRHVQVLADDYVGADDADRPTMLATILEAQRRIELDMDEYLRLPVFPGEALLWGQIRRTLSDVDAAVATMRAHVDARDFKSAASSVKALDAARERAASAVLMGVVFNAREGEQIGQRISAVRRRSLLVALGLDAVSVMMTMLVALVLTRAVGRHATLLRRHHDLLAQRAAELEQFAGRVAHDIRNPIGAASLNFTTIQRRAAGDTKIEGLATRGLSNLQRASRIVDGLLAFARAGAVPAADARADVKAVIGDLLDELGAAAAASQVELRCEPLGDWTLRCDPSILEVLVSNLVFNAIKYMGDGPERKITLRARDAGTAARVEVEDTGVGVPEEMRSAIFAPFMRGATHGQQGIGLGLATVKRICDAHRGRAGVDSVVGQGSVFWFELPKVTREPAVERSRDGSGPIVRGQ
jgi:signal transduction histidine kinase